MAEFPLATTSSEGLSALGSRELRSYELITDTLRDRLGADHANLFAEPVATDHGDRFDWYAPRKGRARALDALAPDDQRRLRERLAALAGDIRGLAATLAASGKDNDLRLSEALGNALHVPGDACIFAVDPGDGSGPHPVLVNWAWVSDDHKAVPSALTGAAKPVAAPPVRPVAAAPAGPPAAPPPIAAPADLSWLWWLIRGGWLVLALMLAAIVILLVEPCA
ncbi:MAG: hypothetical protein CVT84_18585, partial [Alphaproteobacteria bacterium HGW-Alphaproteobacteria-6]